MYLSGLWILFPGYFSVLLGCDDPFFNGVFHHIQRPQLGVPFLDFVFHGLHLHQRIGYHRGVCDLVKDCFSVLFCVRELYWQNVHV